MPRIPRKSEAEIERLFAEADAEDAKLKASLKTLNARLKKATSERRKAFKLDLPQIKLK